MESEAAVAIVQAGGSRGSILLMRRAEREGDSWSGHWSLPGGRRDPADPDMLHTALRELAEECGIHLTEAHLQAALPETLARRKVGPYLPVSPFHFHVDAELPTTLDMREAVAAVWMPLRALLDPANHALRPVPGRPVSMLFPCIMLEGYPLWGFTYRLLMDWLGLGRKTEEGFQGAREVLDFLHSQGLPLAHDWRDDGSIKTAAVRGRIPAEDVIARFGQSGSHVAALNCLEAGRDRVRILGPQWEEYLITSDGF